MMIDGAYEMLFTHPCLLDIHGWISISDGLWILILKGIEFRKRGKERVFPFYLDVGTPAGKMTRNPH